MSSTTTNSFSQNIGTSIAHSVNNLSLLTALQSALTKNDTFVTFDYTGNDGTTVQYQLPSYDSVVNRLRAVEESINSLNTGKGSINLSDGSRRTITLSSIPHTPSQITGLADPTTFTIDSNWFFESLMFPGAQVEIDLTSQIEDSADRVRVSRIILNANDDASRNIWDSDLSINSYDYVSLKTLLQNNNIPYYEDDDIVDLPVVSNHVSGSFQITDDPVLINNNMWYKLDTITYSTISENGLDQGQNNILSVGDQLSFSDSIFEIVEINQNNQQVRLKRINGVQTPGVYSLLNYYEDPFSSKVVKVRFGAHEYNIVYFKGIAENYNLLADQWSTPVKFASDDLVLAGSVGLQQTPFSEYYAQYIVDWGSKMIAEAKEKKITAWYGSTPNSPTINGDDFRVVQINTQINAAIDTTDVKNTAAEIESVKSQISSLKSTIAAQKTDLQAAVNLYTYNSIQQQIATNTTDLNNLQTTYSTLVDSFQTIVRENAAITTDPKYHIRGFFPIPEYKYQDENNLVAEEIIGFDIAYRYIKEDSTAVQLNTFTYTASDGTEVTGTYTDWIVLTGPTKTKQYDEDLQRYIWKAENVADGTETNINQIDIPISKGEKVEIKVRSISEAGYPENPLRSVWSNSVIVDFPSTLATKNEIADLIKKVNDDAITISITNTLDSMGVSQHMVDSIPNTNSVNGMYYNHQSINISFEERGKTTEGTTAVNSISVQEKIEQIDKILNDNTTQGNNNSLEINNIHTEMVDKHTEYENKFISLDSDISTLKNNVEQNKSDLSTIRRVTPTGEVQVHSKRYVIKNTDDSDAFSLTTNDEDGLYVVNNRNSSDNTSIGNIFVGDVYIHPGHEKGKFYSLINKNEDIDKSIIAINSNITKHQKDIDSINASIVTYALNEDLNKVNERVTENRSLIDGIKDGSNIIADEVFLGMDETRLASNKVSGALYVLEGQSEEQLGTIHVEDVNIHTGGYVTGTIVSFNTVADTVDDHTAKLTNITEDLTNAKNTINQITYVDGGNIQLRSNSAIINNDIVTGSISSKQYIMTGGAPFRAINGANTTQLVDGEFRNILLYSSGSGNQVNLNKTINELNASVGSHDEYISGISRSIYYPDGETTLEITGVGSLSANKLNLENGIYVSEAFKIVSSNANADCYIVNGGEIDGMVDGLSIVHSSDIYLHSSYTETIKNEDGGLTSGTKSVLGYINMLDTSVFPRVADASLKLSKIYQEGTFGGSSKTGYSLIADNFTDNGFGYTLRGSGLADITINNISPVDSVPTIGIKCPTATTSDHYAGIQCADIQAHGDIKCNTIYFTVGGTPTNIVSYINSLVANNISQITKFTNEINSLKTQIAELRAQITTT